MTATVGGTTALGDLAARQLANATKTVPQLATITPRWLTHLLQWVPVEAGIYRLNKVKNPEAIKVTCTARVTTAHGSSARRVAVPRIASNAAEAASHGSRPCLRARAAYLFAACSISAAASGSRCHAPRPA